ncbi:MAG: nuclease-related domain-containing protein [Gammaproteobacteria bacterium]|nr:nuclease-related domain-containing protein [Gammaproteobacteria bacterium]
MLENSILWDILNVIITDKEWLIGGLFLLGIFVVLIFIKRKRSVSNPLTNLINKISIESLSNIVLFDDMDGEIHIEYLLLTIRGIVILDVKTSTGTVFGGNQMDEWAILTGQERISIQNPQEALYNRTAALRLLVRDIPILGHILFIQGADFSRDRPDNVILPEELLNLYKKPDRLELERVMEAFSPYWQTICSSARPDL